MAHTKPLESAILTGFVPDKMPPRARFSITANNADAAGGAALDAKEAGTRIVATDRSDFPNQLNNSLAFPGIFRCVLDIRAAAISDEMAKEAAQELAEYAAQQTINVEFFMRP
jgi:malic enzyme